MCAPLLCAVALVATSTTAGPRPMRLADDSKITFTAHQTFSSTDGRFERFDGDFRIDRAQPSRSQVELRIEAASIDTGNSSRDEHLREEDFFHVAEYPKIVFTSKRITPNREGWVEVSGTLRVKSREVPVDFDMQLDWGEDGSVRARGRLTVSRSKLGLDYEAPFYIPSIKDNVNIGLDVRLVP